MQKKNIYEVYKTNKMEEAKVKFLKYKRDEPKSYFNLPDYPY